MNVSSHVGNTRFGGWDFGGETDVFEGVGDGGRVPDDFAVSFLIESDSVRGGAGVPGFFGSRVFGVGGIYTGLLWGFGLGGSEFGQLKEYRA